MKTNPIYIYLLALVALTGCQSMREDATARDKYADAERSLIVVIDTAIAAHKAGQLKGEALEIVKEACKQAGSALDAMNLHIKNGDTISADLWLHRALKAIETAQAYVNTRGV